MKTTILLVTLSFALNTVSEEKTSLKVYTLHYADPTEITSLAPRMMLSTNGLHIETIDKKISVIGTPDQHDIIRQMVREIDTPPQNIQVNVQIDRKSGGRNDIASIRPDGPITIIDGDISGSTRNRFENRSRTSSENVTQMLVASDGRKASLRVGKMVPHVRWLTEYGGRHGYVRDVEMEWKDVGAFLEVEPSIVAPGIIRVRVTPSLSGRLENGEKQTIEFTHLTTEVTVGDGQTINIGGFNKDKEFSSRFLVGRSNDERSTLTSITLTPRILPQPKRAD